MTNESRAEFEAWWTACHQCPCNYKYGHVRDAWDAWQASRKQALEEAAQVCTGIALAPSNVILGVAVKCATVIRGLK